MRCRGGPSGDGWLPAAGRPKALGRRAGNHRAPARHDSFTLSEPFRRAGGKAAQAFKPGFRRYKNKRTTSVMPVMDIPANNPRWR